MNKYLPIGSVVLLKEGSKPILIMGYKMSSVDNKYLMKGNDVMSNKVFDYCAVLYPEGLLDSEHFILFDHENIDKILFSGYISDDYEEINKALNEE